MSNSKVIFKLPAGETRALYVDRERAKLNAMDKAALGLSARDPLPMLVIRVDSPWNGPTKTWCSDVQINGPSRFVSRMDDPLTPKGPAMWIETDAELVVTI